MQVGGEYINKETKIEEVDYNYLKQMLKDMFSKVHVEFENLLVLTAEYFLTRRLLRRMTSHDLYKKVRSF